MRRRRDQLVVSCVKLLTHHVQPDGRLGDVQRHTLDLDRQRDWNIEGGHDRAGIAPLQVEPHALTHHRESITDDLGPQLPDHLRVVALEQVLDDRRREGAELTYFTISASTWLSSS